MVYPLLKIIAYGLVLFLPTAAVIWHFHRARKRADAAAVAPFEELRRRPAGESLRLVIAETDSKIDEWLLLLVIMPIALIYVMASSKKPSLFVAAFAFLVAAICASVVQAKLRPLVTKRRTYQLGFQGERYVAEELNQLLAAGFQVFHDVPFDKYNVDHIVVGPAGVFVVETKTRRKPVKEGKKRYEVEFDGSTLLFPNGRNTDAVEQIRRNVKSVSAWLSSATGDRTSATGILTIPGWYVTEKVRSNIRVLNPKTIRDVVRQPAGSSLSREQIQRAVHQLEQKCALLVT